MHQLKIFTHEFGVDCYKIEPQNSINVKCPLMYILLYISNTQLALDNQTIPPYVAHHLLHLFSQM
jgi:hypothetical protein